MTFGSEDANDVFLVDADTGGELGKNIAGEFERCDRPFIDAGLAEVRGRFDLDWIGEIFSGAAPAIRRDIETG